MKMELSLVSTGPGDDSLSHVLDLGVGFRACSCSHEEQSIQTVWSAKYAKSRNPGQHRLFWCRDLSLMVAEPLANSTKSHEQVSVYSV